MSKKSLVVLFCSFIIAVIAWYAFPAYQFFVYQKGAPYPSVGLLDLPASGPAHQTVSDGVDVQAARAALQALSEHRVQIQAPGISAAVAIGGEVVWTGVAGWADIEDKRPVTPATQFRMGSTSKALTATALARLVQDGRIDLDTPISAYVENLPNAQWRTLTPRQLASHMAGLPDYKENRDWVGLYHTMALRKHYANVFDSLEVFDGSPLLFESGTRFHYATYNTVLLSAVMAAAAGKPFATLISEEVTGPLGMASTAPDPIAPAATMATFYWRKGEQFKPWRRVDLSHRLAGGGFIATPRDLAALGSAWLDNSFIHLSTREVFWQPQQLRSGEVNEERYALGWRIHGGDDYIAKNANHGGVSRGAQSWLMVIPEYQMSVAVMINATTDEFWDFAKVAVKLVDIFRPVEVEAVQPVEET